VAEFADRHSSERETVGFSKASKRLDGGNNFGGSCGCLWVTSRRRRPFGKSSGTLNETGCIGVNPDSPPDGLTDEFRLKLPREFDR
jgi:hypothetical protein